ncbi:hypothetical protein BKA70DRAFT_1430995 [Coprinopsis sp. MPI-PUGE-AT-0042]|nr:hypothetical protein BKA70DRAFT_1430995 [Coprinopsis sp. MPI-PUGE-AT-0042]
MVCLLRSPPVSFLTILSLCFAFREERLHRLSVDYVDRRTPDDLRGLPERLEPEVSAMITVDTSATLGLRVLQERLKLEESRRLREILGKKALSREPPLP